MASGVAPLRTAPHPQPWPLVSVVMPCRNEADFICGCLDSIFTNDYAADKIEVIVVDGMSDDGTRELLARYAAQEPRLRVLDNPRHVTPVALNIGIKAARGGVIMRSDAHASIARDYIRRCVEGLHRYDADNVGGVMQTITRSSRLWDRAIGACLTHPFGVGNSHFRIQSREVREVDTVFGGCYRRDVFDRVGYFDERLTRSQDIEFNTRLRRAGGRIILLPDVVSEYYPRAGFVRFARDYLRNGVWATLPWAYTDHLAVRARHLAPLGLVLTTSLLAVGSLRAVWSSRLLQCLLGAYVGAVAVASAHAAAVRRDPALVPVLPATFVTLHFSYGLGSTWGLLLAARERVRAKRNTDP